LLPHTEAPLLFDFMNAEFSLVLSWHVWLSLSDGDLVLSAHFEELGISPRLLWHVVNYYGVGDAYVSNEMV